MEKDFTLFKVSWFTQLQGSIESLEKIHARHYALIDFLQRNNLTVREVLSKDEPLSDSSCLMRSDLTDKGFKVYQKAEQKWLRGIDRGKSPTDMQIFEKELAKFESKC